jgi:opacity protein-like surface antigen
MILLGMATNVAVAQQAGQPGTAPAQERSGAQQGTGIREQAAVPARVPALPAPLEPHQVVTHVAIPPEELGIAAGAFRLYPDVNVGLTYDTNIYSTRRNEVADWMYTVTPSLVGRAADNDYEMNMRLGASASRYQDNSSQNADDYWIDGQATYKLSGQTNIYGALGYTLSHEDRGSPDLSFGTEPTAFSDTSISAGMFHDFGKGYVRFGAAGSRLKFSNVATSTPGVSLINSTRDRDVNSVGGRLGIRVSPTTDLFVQGTSEQRNYLVTPDGLGYVRNSTGDRVDVGVAINLDQRLVGEAYVGQMFQHYSDARFKSLDITDMGASVRWHTSPWTTYRFNIDRTLDETVIAASPGYLSTSGSAEVEHDLGNKTLVTGGLTAGRHEFQEIARVDNFAEASFGIRHYASNSIYIGASYRYQSRTSDNALANYDRSLMMFTVGSDFGARRRTPYFAYEERSDLNFEEARGDFGGLYAGVQLGLGGVNAVSSGLRDLTAGNTDQGTMAHDGSTGGIFLGHGTMLKQWYLGVELEADTGNTSLSHDHQSGATPAEPLKYTVSQKDSYGAGVRAGYALASGSMLYGRLGLVQTTFNTTLVVNDGAFSHNDTQAGRKIGIGAEVPAGDNMLLRFEYTYAKYDEYHMATTNYDELYQNSTGYFNVGLGWQFGGKNKEAAPPVDPEFLRGVYAGAHLGHGSVQSALSATHFHSGPPAYNDPLQADFGASGMTSGVYLGYGHTFNRVYLGLELDAEPSQAQWKHDRVTSGSGGRDFSVRKLESYGASLRAGYVLANGAMVYGRYGAVNTQFNTQYQRGSSGLVDRDDTLEGTRVGFGVELPVNKSAFWRLDYSVTQYAATPGFSTPGGTPDVVSMTNREDLFRLGFGVRF